MTVRFESIALYGPINAPSFSNKPKNTKEQIIIIKYSW